MAFILGVTGGIGSGKTAATNRFATHGIETIDADIIAREVVMAGSPALAQISSHFGPSILLDNGELNRAKLRECIFNHPEEKEWLENLLHPTIRREIKNRLQHTQINTKAPYTILSAPLLIDTGLQALTDKVLVIDCSEEIQLNRASKRDDNTQDMIKKVMDKQLSRQERLSKADDVINNDGTLDELYRAVDHHHQQLMNTLA